MWDFLGSLFSTGASLYNSSENRKAQEAFNAQQLALGRENMAMQREFAQSGIRWKVADAQAAGLHPLAALGTQGASFSPVTVGGSAYQGDAIPGQDIGRAIKAAGSLFDREQQDADKLKKLTLEKAGLENDILRADLVSRVRREAAAIGPAMQDLSGRADIRSGGVPLPRPGPWRSPSGEAVREDDLKQTIEDVPSSQSGRHYGFKMLHNPAFGSGQAYEDRYGDSELGATVKWLINHGADLEYTWRKSDPLELGGWDAIRGGDRSRYSRGQRNMRGGG